MLRTRLRSCGCTVTGIDLSPNMIEIARAAHPDVRFDIGSLTELPALAERLWFPLLEHEKRVAL